MDLLADVHGEIVRLAENSAEETASLESLDGVKLFHGCTTAHETMTHFAIAAEAIAIREEDQGVFPADQFAAHLEHGPVRVDGTFLVKHLDGDPGRVDDDERLSQDCHRANVAWGRKQRRRSGEQVNE